MAATFPLRQLDVDIHRDFVASDRLQIRFEADIFNVLNQANFASPSALLTDSNFGASRSMMNASFGAGMHPRAVATTRSTQWEDLALYN